MFYYPGTSGILKISKCPVMFYIIMEIGSKTNIFLDNGLTIKMHFILKHTEHQGHYIKITTHFTKQTFISPKIVQLWGIRDIYFHRNLSWLTANLFLWFVIHNFQGVFDFHLKTCTRSFVWCGLQKPVPFNLWFWPTFINIRDVYREWFW